MPPTRPLDERFWEKVVKSLDPDGCWDWSGVKNNHGYGQIRLTSGDKKLMYAHRFMWEFERGAIPEGMCVLHRCDNPSCINVRHLFLGTMKDNTKDMVSKGRWRNQFNMAIPK